MYELDLYWVSLDSDSNFVLSTEIIKRKIDADVETLAGFVAGATIYIDLLNINDYDDQTYLEIKDDLINQVNNGRPMLFAIPVKRGSPPPNMKNYSSHFPELVVDSTTYTANLETLEGLNRRKKFLQDKISEFIRIAGAEGRSFKQNQHYITLTKSLGDVESKFRKLSEEIDKVDKYFKGDWKIVYEEFNRTFTFSSLKFMSGMRTYFTNMELFELYGDLFKGSLEYDVD